MSKYDALTDYLDALPHDAHAMTFAEIEAVTGEPLPGSAYKYRAWWSNNPSNNVMTHAWLKAGWISADVDMEDKKLVFKRTRKAPLPKGFRENPKAQAPFAPPTQPEHLGQLVISGLERTTMLRLETKAALARRSVADVAREILEASVELTMPERLAAAANIRAASPMLKDVDVARLIREDRDSR